MPRLLGLIADPPELRARFGWINAETAMRADVAALNLAAAPAGFPYTLSIEHIPLPAASQRQFSATHIDAIDSSPPYVYGLGEYIANYLQHGSTEGPWPQGGWMHLKSFVEQNRLVERINSGEVDEVWYGGVPIPAVFEGAMLAPENDAGAYQTHNHFFHVPGLRRRAIFHAAQTGNYNMLHNFGHRCLAAETEVLLASGQRAPIASLVGQTPAVLAHTDDGLRPAIMTDVRRTGRNRSVVAIRLSNGQSVRCTPDHRFRLASGDYVRADQLAAGDRLTSFDVLPTDPPTNVGDAVERNPIPSRQYGQGFVGLGLDFSDLFWRQLARKSEFCGSIGLVVGMASEKQMIGTDARRVVTLMTDEQPLGDGSIRQFPREPMGEADYSTTIQPSVAMLVQEACVDPAWPQFGYRDRAILVDLGPEQLFRRGLDTVLDGLLDVPSIPGSHLATHRAIGREDVLAKRPPTDRAELWPDCIRDRNSSLGALGASGAAIPTAKNLVGLHRQKDSSAHRAGFLSVTQREPAPTPVGTFHSAPIGTKLSVLKVTGEHSVTNDALPRQKFSEHSVIVLSVDPDGAADVYDFTVAENHNVALSAGIVAHNCEWQLAHIWSDHRGPQYGYGYAEQWDSPIHESGIDSPWRMWSMTHNQRPGLANCGSWHFMPNSKLGYVYDHDDAVPSLHRIWERYPEGFPIDLGRNDIYDFVSAADWASISCPPDLQHYVWLMQQLPKNEGEWSGRWANWWRYICDPNEEKGRGQPVLKPWAGTPKPLPRAVTRYGDRVLIAWDNHDGDPDDARYVVRVDGQPVNTIPRRGAMHTKFTAEAPLGRAYTVELPGRWQTTWDQNVPLPDPLPTPTPEEPMLLLSQAQVIIASIHAARPSCRRPERWINQGVNYHAVWDSLGGLTFGIAAGWTEAQLRERYTDWLNDARMSGSVCSQAPPLPPDPVSPDPEPEPPPPTPPPSPQPVSLKPLLEALAAADDAHARVLREHAGRMP